MIEPKPCPWCGAIPAVFPECPAIEGNCWGRVQCMNKACPAKPSVGDGEKVSDERGSDAYKACAIERWNRRSHA